VFFEKILCPPALFPVYSMAERCTSGGEISSVVTSVSAVSSSATISGGSIVQPLKPSEAKLDLRTRAFVSALGHVDTVINAVPLWAARGLAETGGAFQRFEEHINRGVLRTSHNIKNVLSPRSTSSSSISTSSLRGAESVHLSVYSRDEFCKSADGFNVKLRTYTPYSRSHNSSVETTTTTESRPTASSSALPSLSGMLKSAIVFGPPPPLQGVLEQPCILYIHGGGFVLNSIETHDVLCRHLCRGTALRVISVEYRQPPYNPITAAFQDVLAAYRYCLPLCRNRVVVSGDSAGGHLAVSLSLQLLAARDEVNGIPSTDDATAVIQNMSSERNNMSMSTIPQKKVFDRPIPASVTESVHQSAKRNGVSIVLPHENIHELATLPLPSLVLPLYPALDLERGIKGPTASRERYQEGWILSLKMIDGFADTILCGLPEESETCSRLKRVPFFSPLRANKSLLSNFPPILLVPAEHDLLSDHSILFLNALQESGGTNHIELVMATGQVHGFAQFPQLRVGQEIMATVYEKARQILGLPD
jgi:acetyl esterase/lipase